MTSPNSLLTIEQALAMEGRQNVELHVRHLNPRVAKLLETIHADEPVVRAEGPYEWDSSGERYITYSTMNLGHNHPRVLRALELMAGRPTLVHGLNHLTAALAHNLSELTPGQLTRVLFASAGSEVVDAAIRIARAATGRKPLVACRGNYHGRTLGALSLADGSGMTERIGPLIPGVHSVPFGDLNALEQALVQHRPAGFFVEPVQGEGGIVPAPPGYLRGVRTLCSNHGVFMIADEMQTGLGRTGRLFAVQREDVVPDILLLGKALGGGIEPVSALLTTEEIYNASRGDDSGSPHHTSAFGGNSRSCAAAIATLDAVVAEQLPERAEELGTSMLASLRTLAQNEPLIKAVRGQGLMIGIELVVLADADIPESWRSRGAGTGLLTGMVLMELRRKYKIIASPGFRNPAVLRVLPALTIEKTLLDYFVESLATTLQWVRSKVPHAGSGALSASS